MQTRISGATALASLLLLLGIPEAARALAVTSFAPGDVTTGTRLTIKGDFGDLVALRRQPEVQGRRSGTPKTVKFQVLAFSRRTIIARVREVPSTKYDPAAGKTWSLVVRSPLPGGEIAEADDLFTTAGPMLVALPEGEATPDQVVPLYAMDPGAKSPTVLVGRKKAKVLRSQPAGQDRDEDPWRVQFRVPKLRNGFYPVRLENSLGRAPGAFSLLVFGSVKGGVVPYARAVVEGRPGFDTSLCTWSALDGGIRMEACMGDSCERALSVEFAPAVDGSYQPAEIHFADETGSWSEVGASAKLVPAPSADLLAGAFLATLQSDVDRRAPPIRVRGYFQASPSAPPP